MWDKSGEFPESPFSPWQSSFKIGSEVFKLLLWLVGEISQGSFRLDEAFWSWPIVDLSVGWSIRSPVLKGIGTGIGTGNGTGRMSGNGSVMEPADGMKIGGNDVMLGGCCCGGNGAMFKFGGNLKPVCWWVGWGRKFWNEFGKLRKGSWGGNCCGWFKGGGVVMFTGEGELLPSVRLKEEGRPISAADNGGHTDSWGINRREAGVVSAVDEGGGLDWDKGGGANKADISKPKRN